MNTPILITSLILAALVLYFWHLVATRSTKSYVRNRLTSYKRKLKALTEKYVILEDRLAALESRTRMKEADPRELGKKGVNPAVNMEDRYVKDLKQVVAVNGEPIK